MAVEQKPLRRVPIHRALHRPDLMGGCERELFLIVALCAAVLIGVALTWVTTVVGLLMWFGCIAALRQMAKADPIMSKVYFKHIKYKPYYLPHSSPSVQPITYKR